MSLVTFNVHSFVEMEEPGQNGFRTFTDFLTDHQVEILCLQECYETVPSFLQKIYKNVEQDTRTGLAILTNYQIITGPNIHRFSKSINKGCLSLSVLLPNFQLVELFNLHLDHQCEEKRLEELGEILPLIKETYLNKSTYIVGDFNSLTRSDYPDELWRFMVTQEARHTAKESLVIPLMSSVLEDTWDGVVEDAYSYPRRIKGSGSFQAPPIPVTSLHRRRVDYIFSNQKHHRSHIINHLRLSDHYPVMIALLPN